jgi:hypothetical protein
MKADLWLHAWQPVSFTRDAEQAGVCVPHCLYATKFKSAGDMRNRCPAQSSTGLVIGLEHKRGNTSADIQSVGPQRKNGAELQDGKPSPSGFTAASWRLYACVYADA